MSPHIEKLRESLQELRAELHSLDTLDAESRQLLEATQQELDDALRRDTPGTIETIEHQTIAEQLHQAVENFGESHPALSRIVGNIVDVLAQIGI